MIAFKDFVPQKFDMDGRSGLTKMRSRIQGTTHETIEDVLDRMNGWIIESNVDVINVETVIFQKMKRTLDIDQIKNREVIRLWYQPA